MPIFVVTIYNNWSEFDTVVMNRIFKNIFLGGLLPFAWMVITYNQNHGFFCESYIILAIAICCVILMNAVFTLLRINHFLINSFWLVLLIPSCSNNYVIDIACRCFVFACICLLHKKIPFKKIGVVIAILLLINVFQISFRDLSSRNSAQKLLQHEYNTEITLNENIYWVICDAYTSSLVLKKYYNFDNIEFYTTLKNLEFETYDGNLTYDKINYYATLKAVNTYMNFCSFDVTKEHPLTLHYAIKDSLLSKILSKNGYSLHITKSRFPFLHNLNFNNFGPDNINSITHFAYACFKQNTIIRQYLCTFLNNELYSSQNKIFDFLSNFTQNNFNKNFYYIHLDSPHAPFILNYDGKFVDDQKSSIWGENDVGANGYKMEDYTSSYISQLKSLNKKLITIMQNIVTQDPSATIVLQGDHGTFTTTDKLENSSILFALRATQTFNNLIPEKIFKQFIYGEL